jgi:hypothetical protein
VDYGKKETKIRRDGEDRQEKIVPSDNSVKMTTSKEQKCTGRAVNAAS